jgi:glycosyltransferase involved in cell wall biosynthesis
MKKAPKCSVIIPTYNRETLLGYTLESLTRQRLVPGQFEVLVVDDGSSDATAQMVDRYRERLDLQYFFQPDEGWRTAKARNVGIAHAAGDVCVFVDAGVLLHSGCLEAHVARHESTTEPLAICGYIYGFNVDNEDAEIIARTIDIHDPDATMEVMDGRQEHLDVREYFYRKYTDDFHDLPAPWPIFWTANVSARTRQIRALGAFDEAFQSWGGEDLDLAYRLHRDGAKFVLDRGAKAIHYPHYKSFDENEQAAKKNYRYMAAKYGTPIIRLLLETPEVNPFNMNDVIRERELPTCSEYLAGQRKAG